MSSEDPRRLDNLTPSVKVNQTHHEASHGVHASCAAGTRARPQQSKIGTFAQAGAGALPGPLSAQPDPVFRLPVLGDCPRHYRPIFDLDLALDDEL